MNDVLKIRELIVKEILAFEVDPYAGDMDFGKMCGYHKGLTKAKEIIDSFLDDELVKMAKAMGED